MSDKSFLKEIVDEIYPINKTAAFYDLALIIIVAFVFAKALLSEPTEYFAESVGGVYLAVALVAGIMYSFRRGVWASGGCLGILVRLALCGLIGLIYAPFMLWFAIRKLLGRPAPNV